jgi:hypothetical protein
VFLLALVWWRRSQVVVVSVAMVLHVVVSVVVSV